MEHHWINNTISRYPVADTTHFNSSLWKTDTLTFIQEKVAYQLMSNPDYFVDPTLQPNSRVRPLVVPLEQIRNVADSISQSNPHIGTEGQIGLITDYIVSYLVNEETVNKKPVYDSKVIKYDGNFGIQRMSVGEIPIKKKRLNTIGRMF